MFTIGQLVRYREGTRKAGEVYVVAEDFIRGDWAVNLTECNGKYFWANPKDLESAE